MRTARLFNSARQFVHEALVPPFEPPAEVVVLGSRHFRVDGEDGYGRLVYVECMAFWVPPLADIPRPLLELVGCAAVDVGLEVPH